MGPIIGQALQRACFTSREMALSNSPWTLNFRRMEDAVNFEI